MDYLSIIQTPIKEEIKTFNRLFEESLSHAEGLLDAALSHIRQRGGKRMRPLLTLLMAKTFGNVNDITYSASLGLELLHTASLVHDDVVDESEQRRGQASVNASFNNKVAVLVGDYILSTALFHVSQCGQREIVSSLARLGQVLSNGELLQLNNIGNKEISEEVYYQIIQQKTASLFATCAHNGALSVGASSEQVTAAKQFGDDIGMIFQIRDDIFDYYPSKEIGKPTGNDMAEGKLTLPVIYALHTHPSEAMMTLAKKVKNGQVNKDEIAVLVEYAKNQGGIDYAISKMDDYAAQAQLFIDRYVKDPIIHESMVAYLAFVAQRNI